MTIAQQKDITNLFKKAFKKIGEKLEKLDEQDYEINQPIFFDINRPDEVNSNTNLYSKYSLVNHVSDKINKYHSQVIPMLADPRTEYSSLYQTLKTYIESDLKLIEGI